MPYFVVLSIVWYNWRMNNEVSDGEARYRQFSSLIQSISRSIQRLKNLETARFGLKGKQVQAIFSLYNYPEGLSLTELCNLCIEDKGGMSRTLKELTEKDLVFVDETAEKEKRYKKPYKLTEKGADFAKIVADKVGSYAERSGSDLSDEDRAVLYRSLESIAKNLDYFCQNPD